MEHVNGWTAGGCARLRDRILHHADMADVEFERERRRRLLDAAVFLEPGRWRSAAARPELMDRLVKLSKTGC